MPNHIMNRITIQGEREAIALERDEVYNRFEKASDVVEEVFERFNTHYPAKLSLAHGGKIICHGPEGYGWLDETTVFKRRSDVTGLPEGYKIEIEQASDCFPDFEKVIPPPNNMFRGDLGEKERRQCLEDGRANWFDWQSKNWGTKWNSYSCKRERFNVFVFKTAWSAVPSILGAMSREFPKIRFGYEYADEDTGCNVGIGYYKNGNSMMKYPSNGSRGAYDIAFKLRPDIREHYFIDESGQYQYRDEDLSELAE